MSSDPAASLIALTGLPLISEHDDLAGLLVDAAKRTGVALKDGDVLVVAQKIVSKAEGRMVRLADVHPSDEARALAETCDKDPRLVELVLMESERVVRAVLGVLIVRHRLGHVMANAGIDQSNVGPGGSHALLLPVDPDKSAARLAARLRDETGSTVAVIVADSFGRPWRMGTCGAAIGAAGLDTLQSRVGVDDLFGRPLQHSDIAVADEMASAASLLMGQAAEAIPAVILRGFDHLLGGTAQANALVRAPEKDLFL